MNNQPSFLEAKISGEALERFLVSVKSQNESQKVEVNFTEEYIENSIDKLKKYLLDSQNLIQQTLNVVEDNTQAASLSNVSCEDIVAYAIRNQSLTTCPTYQEVSNSYLANLNSRTTKKTPVPDVILHSQIQDLEGVKNIPIRSNNKIEIQPGFGQDNVSIVVTEDESMPNICIHKKQEKYETFFTQKNQEETRQLRIISHKNGMMESELSVINVKILHNLNQQGNANQMVIESFSMDIQGSVQSSEYHYSI